MNDGKSLNDKGRLKSGIWERVVVRRLDSTKVCFQEYVGNKDGIYPRLFNNIL